jgi:hypothetical protein
MVGMRAAAAAESSYWSEDLYEQAQNHQPGEILAKKETWLS